MAGPGDEITPAADGCGHLRASRADREQVITMLQVAFVQGLMGKDEFDLRVGRALVPQTRAGLAALTADLPVAPPPGPARARIKAPGPFTRIVGAATLLYAGMWAWALLLSPHSGDNPVAGHLIVGGLLLWLTVVIFTAWLKRSLTFADPPGNTPDSVA